jgi:hypothetical protein
MTTLTPELLATLKQLSPEDKGVVRDLLDEDDPPPGRSGEEEAAEIGRRAAMVASGNYVSLSREEAEQQVREAIRKLGVEL